MTISTKAFQRLQSGVPDADDKRVMNPVNALMKWAGTDLPGELNTHFAAISQSTSVQIAAAISSHVSTLPSFFAHKNNSAQISVSSATDVKVTFGTEEWDTGSYFASSTWTPPAGKYRITANIRWANTNAVANEQLWTKLFKNGAEHLTCQWSRVSTNATAFNTSFVVDVDGDDTLEIYVHKAGAGDGQIAGATNDTWACGEAIA